jgi:hypothetical protein
MGNVLVTSDENSAKNWRNYFSSFAFVFLQGREGAVLVRSRHRVEVGSRSTSNSFPDGCGLGPPNAHRAC